MEKMDWTNDHYRFTLREDVLKKSCWFCPNYLSRVYPAHNLESGTQTWKGDRIGDLGIFAWLITNWRGQWWYRCHSRRSMGSTRLGLLRHAMCHLWCALPLVLDWLPPGITLRPKIHSNGSKEDGAMGWMWANDPVIDARRAGSVTHDTSDGWRLQSRRPPIKPHQLGG